MEHKIVLGADKFVSINERFMAGEKTVLAFESKDESLDELFATVTDGTFAKRFPVKGGKLDISDYCKKFGVVEIRLELFMRGAFAKAWQLEPFVVRENGKGYELIPEIALLRKEIKTMKRIIKELNSKIKETM